MKPAVASLYQAVELRQEIPPLLIGERANANGSKKFRELLLTDDYQGCLRIAIEQENKGAQVIDLCAAYAGRDEAADLSALVRLCASSLKAPLMIDSTSPECIEACLRLYPGRALVNSVNLEDGGDTLRRVCLAARRYGAAVVALTIDEQGMAMISDEKFAIAQRIHALAVDACGLRPQDILFDCLTFTVGSGDESLADSAAHTLAAIRRIKAELPGCFTVLGISNISFGLAPAARKILNSVFLHQAVAAGLDAAIVDAGRIVPLASIPEEERRLCVNLLENRRDGDESPLMRFIHFFSARQNSPEQQEQPSQTSLEEQLSAKVLRGDKEGLGDLLAMLRERMRPLELINQILVPAMRQVGELFSRGEMLLPFVLQSAEVMKAAVTELEPFLEKNEGAGATRVLLATVQGDVHDIGKNLVDIILSNNGYTVYNLGIKVTVERIIEQAKALQADVIGLSGLLVKSALIMQESLPQYRDAGLNIPILLGGAALTAKFVAQSCVPLYPGPVVYCADAFAGLKAVQEFEQGRLQSTREQASRPHPSSPKARTLQSELDTQPLTPNPPFWGQRYIEEIDPFKVLAHMKLQALFRGRWGYRRAKMNDDQYEQLIQQTVRPLYDDLVERALGQGWMQPKLSYGYFRCHAEQERLCVEADSGNQHFDFPRQQHPPFLCIADYFKSAAQGADLLACFVVTIGARVGQEIARLYQENAYHEYLLLHGLSVELTEALAEYAHQRIRRELGIAAPATLKTGQEETPGGQGCRYGFGYPACPDLEAQQPLFALLKPEAIGIQLSESMQMIPEQSTSAIVAHHPLARYFSIN